MLIRLNIDQVRVVRLYGYGAVTGWLSWGQAIEGHHGADI